ncbi:histone-lysine N-methyltransferase, H3 lysine-4 specific [Plasmodium gonderi]|uniref:Histone-lysine N-methyltransferase, H3 lysine-4 specific n=1 Tax=Plasmodium gonderi TaxID=77519 RepID=A0A1Y1JQT1_PLAGO|nr:histone-lysine N-methyltransferase, H3 lysine-4 specific [Plasmodium gonderi]GAW83587.1 histone-lysine N-methyltransferase, H3 lysine-4 specific [Plasmodium gonderi]
MSFSPIKYESKILSNLASMLKLSEKTDKEIWNEIKEEKVEIKFEIDEDIKKVIDISKINCTCDESKKKMELYKGKKFEYYYNVETYGVDFFIDICNALARSNYKQFLSEEGKREIMNGLRIRRNSNLYKYVSFFLSKERLNRDRLNDGKSPEHIFHCFKCLKSVLHIYIDDQNSCKKKLYLNDNKYITEQMEEEIENDLLNEKKKNSNTNPLNSRDGIISVSKYKTELTSLTRKSNEKIIKTIFEHTKDIDNGKKSNEFNMKIDNIPVNMDSNQNRGRKTNKSNTFENINHYNESNGFFDKHDLTYFSDTANSLSNDQEQMNRNKNVQSKSKITNPKYKSIINSSLEMNKGANIIFLSKDRERKWHNSPISKKGTHSVNSVASQISGTTRKNDTSDLEHSIDANVSHVVHPKKDNKIEGNDPYLDPGEMDKAKFEVIKENQCASKRVQERENQEEENKISIVANTAQTLEDSKNGMMLNKECDVNSISEMKFAHCSTEEKKNMKSNVIVVDKSHMKDEAIMEGVKNIHKNDMYEKCLEDKNGYNVKDDYDFNVSDDASYSTDDSNYKRCITRRTKKLQEQGKIVIDLNILNGNLINASDKKKKEEKIEEKFKEKCQEKHKEMIRMNEIRKMLEEKKMIFCKIEDVAKRRNKRYIKTQVLSEDSKIQRAYFSHKMKKFYNSKSGYFGCGWSNNKTQWIPFIHAPFFDNHHNTIYKNRNKKLYEEIYDTLLHGRIHPSIKVVELKDHKHPVRLCTPYYEDCYSVVYTGKKILATDDRVVFGEYTGYVANNRELSQERHQYTFALSFNKKVFNGKKNVLFINEIESDEGDVVEKCKLYGREKREDRNREEKKNDQNGKEEKKEQNGKVKKKDKNGEEEKNDQNGKEKKKEQNGKVKKNDQNGKEKKKEQNGKVKKNDQNGKEEKNDQNGKVKKKDKNGEEEKNDQKMEAIYEDSSKHTNHSNKICEDEICLNNESYYFGKSFRSPDTNGRGSNQSNFQKVRNEKCTASSNNKGNKKSKDPNNMIILPDNYTYAVDSSYMFNEMSLVNHYKTCSMFNNYDFRINAEWQLVYLDGWPHIILTSIPGVEINTGEEIFADFGFEWFERVNDICLNGFIKNNYAHRLRKLNLCEEKDFNGIDDIVEKYNLIKNYTTCNICMYSINTDSSNNFTACSGCNHIYHLKCVQKINAEVNENYDWFCSSCIQFCINVVNQEEFLSYIEKENQKKLIDLFSDMCTENSNKLVKLLQCKGSNDNSWNATQWAGEDTTGESTNGNCGKNYDKIRKLLYCKENINDLIKNKDIINSYLENTWREINLIDNSGESEDLFSKNDQMKYLLQNSFELHLLVEYKKKIDDLLLSREKIDTFLNDKKAMNTMKLRKQTINYLLENRKYIEKLVDSIEQGIPIVLPHTKKDKNSCSVEKSEQHIAHEKTPNDCQDQSLNLLKEEKQNQMMELLHEDKMVLQTVCNQSPCMAEKPDLSTTDERNSNFSISYESILYKKSNAVVKNLKDIRKIVGINETINNCSSVNDNCNHGGNKNLCFNNMMKISKKIIGFPLIKDFERGLSTNQPCLPLNDHLKMLSVCTICYSKHNDLAKAIICRVTKMHFESNYNDGLSDEDMFKTSTECIQSVIRELANTIKEYRRRELSEVYVQELERSGSSCSSSVSSGMCSSARVLLTEEKSDMNEYVNSTNNSVSRSTTVLVNSNKKKGQEKAFYDIVSDLSCNNKCERNRNYIIQNNTPSISWDNKMNYTDDYTCMKVDINSALGGKHPREEEGDNNNSMNKKAKHNSKSHNKMCSTTNGNILKKKMEESENMNNEEIHGFVRKKYSNHMEMGNKNNHTTQERTEDHSFNDLHNNLCRISNIDLNLNHSKDESKKKNKNHIHFENESLDGTKEEIINKTEDYITLEQYSQSHKFIPLIGIELGKTKIQREFTNGTFVGTVTEQIKDEHDNKFFVVTYEDGDAEWMNPFFLFQELLKQSTNNVDYPLASTFKDVFNPEYKKDLKLGNYTLELKIERRKKKSNCESASNNNSVTKKQKSSQEESSTRKKKQRF